MFEMPCGQAGVLPVQWLKKAVRENVIRSEIYKIPQASFQPASLDLRLGETAYRLRSSFLPGDRRVLDTQDIQMEEFSLRDGAVLEQNRPYLIPLIEELNLPKDIRAKANPRSSTGRLDIFTRVITDHSHRFDEISGGYQGKLYLEVVSRSFTVKVKTGLSLNQLRLIKGISVYDDEQIKERHKDDPLILFNGGQLPFDDLDADDGLSLSVDLVGDKNGVVGYRAKKNSSLIDLSLIAQYEGSDFWEPIVAEYNRRLVLEREEFYLLLSAEGVRIPPTFAAEMTALDPTSGEFRTHYAGFFDPGFGYSSTGTLSGTRAVMEVRAHDVPFMIQDRQKVCRLKFEKTIESPDLLYGTDVGSTYQDQGLTLSKHFRPMNLSGNPQFLLFDPGVVADRRRA